MTATKSNKRPGPGVSSSRKRKRSGGQPTLAEQADRHALYQEAVQNVEDEIDFVDSTFKARRGRRATIIREDFCGTANTSCEWVRRRRENRAIGVDLDPEVLEWGREHNVASLPGDGARRIELRQEDALTVQTEPVDAVLAMNFSYWLFQERDQLRRYFETVRDALVEDGILFLDAYGGYEAHQEIEEERECEGFTYVWEQASFDPISAEMTCYIHFEFPDHSRMRRAFSYTWRLWSLPELRELLSEAGFRRVTIYWEGYDEDTGEGNGVFEPVDRGDPDAGWLCYLVAEK